MNLILCGLQASGKTTLGKRLSAELQYAFIDTDKLIESAYATQTGKQLSCRSIYSEEGATYFRALETQEIIRLKPLSHTVIALGGGTLETAENLSYLKQLGTLIYLKVPLELAWQRVVLTGLPAYVDPQDPRGSFYKIAQERISLYERAAHFVIETNDGS